MKTLKLTLISFFLIFSFSGYAQTNWTGSGDGTSFSDFNNWDNGIPTIGSMIIFDIGGDIHITNIPNSFVSSSSAISDMMIQNNTNVYFDNSAAGSIDFYVDNIEIEGGSSLHLTGSNTIDVFTQTANIYGTLDAGRIHKFSTFGTGNGIDFIDSATFITANTGGVNASIQGNFNYNNQFHLTYNGVDPQNTGLSGQSQIIGFLTVENPSGVKMNNNMSVNTLNLTDGDFDIDNFKLTISGEILYTSGSLQGNLSGSVLQINEPASTDIFINTPIQLDSLIINDLNANTTLINGNILDVNNLDIQNGPLYIDDCTLSINKTYTANSGASQLNGGFDAILIFNSLTHSPSDLNAIELKELTYAGNYNLTLEGDLTVDNFLDMQNGKLNLNNNTLTLNGNYYGSGGILAAPGGSSTIIIDNTNGNTDDMYLEFDNTNHSLYSLTINKPDGIVNIDSDIDILDQLNIDGGHLRINNTLNINPDIEIDADINNYIIIGTAGIININGLISGNDYSIPFGTDNYFAPLTLTPSNNITNISFTVHDTVYSEGNYGIPLQKRNVNLCWEIYNSASADFDLTLSWEPNSEFPDFDNNQSYISNFTGEEWDNIGTNTSTTANGLFSQHRNITGETGFFAVFSGTNYKPTSSDNTVTTTENTVYIFSPSDFPYDDTNGDNFAKIMIGNLTENGTLFFDYNDNDNPDSGDTLYGGEQIFLYEIEAGKLKFLPDNNTVGIPYANFGFKVSDGRQYSINDNVMTINVSNNLAPVAPAEQSFTLPEHSPEGTVAGKIEANDPDGDNIYFYPLEDGVIYSDAFKLNDDGTIAVDNSNKLEYSLNPTFRYNIDVCDDGLPILCTTVHVTINLEEVIRDLVPANFISPNGDGHNDRWFVKGLENDTYEAFIFNGNGKLLFYSADYKNGWEGKSRGNELPPGVYYYLLKSPTFEKSGTITLVR